MKKLIFISIMLFLCASCATTHVTSLPEKSPFPIVRESNLSHTGMSGIYLLASIIQLKTIKKDKEFYTIPTYYPNNSVIKVDETTSMIYVVVNVKNSKRLDYSLWAVYTTQMTGEEYPIHVEQMKYKYSDNGKDSIELKFVVPMPSQAKEGSYHIELRDKNGNLRTFIGSLKFKW